MSGKDDVFRDLDDPVTVVQALFEQVELGSRVAEIVYLDSNLLDHRWGADTFNDPREEFEYKAVWVAKVLRDSLGKPEHSAYLAVLERLSVGLRAAAWWVRGIVVYVSLRYEANQVGTALDRHHFTVVLGAAVPSSKAPGSEGDEGRASVGPAARLPH